ncbi:hypothetical protein PFI31113_01795 [Pandoraea fibrosis]|uniref:Uncharacterized protein n=2 Tax=Pandoraea fibrosis TaxID=1891094 RepID=A0A5E4U4Q0_9BURK|nr:hypothetical protein PFI31113_01795 [Pandoraea fibrosis]
MSSISHQRAIRTTPQYDLPTAARRPRQSTSGRLESARCRRSPSTREYFVATFVEARCTRASVGLREMTARSGDDASREPTAIWRAALAVMLISHLATPATAALPDRSVASPPRDTEPPVEGHLPHPASNHATDSGATILVQRIEHPAFKSDYTFPDVLRSVSSAREPFRRLGESVGDAIEILGGRDMAPGVRQGITVSGELFDIATGFIPEVQLVRLPGELAGVVVDSLDGKLPTGDVLSGLVQGADPRTFGSSMTPHARPKVPPPMGVGLPIEPIVPLSRRFHPVPRAKTAARRHPPSEHNADTGREATDGAEHIAVDPVDLARESTHDDRSASAAPLHIAGEADHLSGYEQVFPADQLPEGERPRLLVMNGERYIGGEAGYYRATRGGSDDHWLIDAPRRDKAQVPVTFDAASGQWRAHAPLRLCGGGCNQSKALPTDSIDERHAEIEAVVGHLHEEILSNGLPSDSIDERYVEIKAAVGHLYDEKMQLAILRGMETLAHMHLLRTNRPDTRGTGDNSIMAHRAALRKAMAHIDRYAPLVTQQRQAAEITYRHYDRNHYAEAFCHENAEILFHQLLQGGVPEDRIRIITITPQRRSPHVLVLYTETHDLTTLLDLATPQPPIVNHRDGISGVTFSGFIYMNKKTTLLLDPWSRIKAFEFSRARDERDVMRMLDNALADVGHQSGQPFTVSVTRPFGTRIFGNRQHSISSLSTSGSPARLGKVFDGVESPPSDPEALSRPESESRGTSASNGDTVPST